MRGAAGQWREGSRGSTGADHDGPAVGTRQHSSSGRPGGGTDGGPDDQIWEVHSPARPRRSASGGRVRGAAPGPAGEPAVRQQTTQVQKVLTAVRGGQPRTSHLYGSWAPNVAQIRSVVTHPVVKASRPSNGRLGPGTGGRGHRPNGKGDRASRPWGQPAVVYNKTLLAKGRAAAARRDGGPWGGFRGPRSQADQPGVSSRTRTSPGATRNVWTWEPRLGGGVSTATDNKKAGSTRPPGGPCEPCGPWPSRTSPCYPGPERLLASPPTGNSGKNRDDVTGPWEPV